MKKKKNHIIIISINIIIILINYIDYILFIDIIYYRILLILSEILDRK